MRSEISKSPDYNDDIFLVNILAAIEEKWAMFLR
jgi:hypothetical protein